jgi:phosphoglycolate phosphatase
VARRDLVLLDLDGTLTDSAPGIIACIRYALDGLGQPVPDDAVLRGFLGPPLAVTFGQGLGLPPEMVDAAIEKYRERYHDVGLFENAVYPGVVDALSALGAQSDLAVATSKPTYSATRILEHFGLADRFAFIGGADLAGERHDKAAVIAHTLDELAARGVDAPGDRVVMVGDREHDVHGARTHGIDTVGVLWGYGSAEELTAAGAVTLARTPADLPALCTR